MNELFFEKCDSRQLWIKRKCWSFLMQYDVHLSFFLPGPLELRLRVYFNMAGLNTFKAQLSFTRWFGKKMIFPYGPIGAIPKLFLCLCVTNTKNCGLCFWCTNCLASNQPATQHNIALTSQTWHSNIAQSIPPLHGHRPIHIATANKSWPPPLHGTLVYTLANDFPTRRRYSASSRIKNSFLLYTSSSLSKRMRWSHCLLLLYLAHRGQYGKKIRAKKKHSRYRKDFFRSLSIQERRWRYQKILRCALIPLKLLPWQKLLAS